MTNIKISFQHAEHREPAWRAGRSTFVEEARACDAATLQLLTFSRKGWRQSRSLISASRPERRYAPYH
jgi:hypothetical protein